jgi:5'-methylthioinosine phosphorylase
MARVAVIGGSGAAFIPAELNADSPAINEWGAASAALTHWSAHGHDVVFLPRHGVGRTIAPHAINYRANMQVISDFGADWVIALNTVGGISEEAAPGQLVVPDQLVDYTWGRTHSYYADSSEGIEFIDFTMPYSSKLRHNLLDAAARIGIAPVPEGTYGATQGPRLETAAEIDRMEQDGCQIVGMTGMPEAALARELTLEYACLAIVVNQAAGRGNEDMHAEIGQYLEKGMAQALRVLEEMLKSF